MATAEALMLRCVSAGSVRKVGSANGEEGIVDDVTDGAVATHRL
jgi:hypothetical protein